MLYLRYQQSSYYCHATEHVHVIEWICHCWKGDYTGLNHRWSPSVHIHWNGIIYRFNTTFLPFNLRFRVLDASMLNSIQYNRDDLAPGRKPTTLRIKTTGRDMYSDLENKQAGDFPNWMSTIHDHSANKKHPQIQKKRKKFWALQRASRSTQHRCPPGALGGHSACICSIRVRRAGRGEDGCMA